MSVTRGLANFAAAGLFPAILPRRREIYLFPRLKYAIFPLFYGVKNCNSVFYVYPIGYSPRPSFWASESSLITSREFFGPFRGGIGYIFCGSKKRPCICRSCGGYIFFWASFFGGDPAKYFLEIVFNELQNIL